MKVYLGNEGIFKPVDLLSLTFHVRNVPAGDLSCNHFSTLITLLLQVRIYLGCISVHIAVLVA